MLCYHRSVKYDQVEGKNPVLEALRGRRAPFELLLARSLRDDRALQEIIRLANRRKVSITTLPREELDRLARTDSHQGVILRLEPYRYTGFRRLQERILEEEEPPLLLVLDGVTDPHNLGSVIRTAAAAGVYAVILPRHRAAPLTPTVARVASGAVEHVTVCTVPNLTAVIEELKKMGFWVVGADAAAEQDCYGADLTGRLALVLGAEHSGLSRLVKGSCDLLVRIPMPGRISSLNVGVAAGVLVFEALRQRRKAAAEKESAVSSMIGEAQAATPAIEGGGGS